MSCARGFSNSLLAPEPAFPRQGLYQPPDEVSADDLHRFVLQDGWHALSLPETIRDTRSFFEAVRASLPLDPTLVMAGGRVVWDALSDSLLGRADQPGYPEGSDYLAEFVRDGRLRSRWLPDSYRRAFEYCGKPQRSDLDRRPADAGCRRPALAEARTQRVRIINDLGTDPTYVCADPPCDLEPLPVAIYAPPNATTFNYLIYIYRSASAAKMAEEEATGTNALDGSRVVYRRKANILVMLAPTKRIIEQVEGAFRDLAGPS